MEVLEPAESEGLHGVLHARLLVPDDLDEPRDAHAEDSPDPGRPRRLRQVHLARSLRAVVVVNVVGRADVSYLRQNEVLKGGFLVPPPGERREVGRTLVELFLQRHTH